MLYTKPSDTQPNGRHTLLPAHMEQPPLAPALPPFQGAPQRAKGGRPWGRRLLLSLSLGVLCSLCALLFSPPPPVYAQSMDEGLVGYWPFDEGSGASSADRSGNGNTATLSPEVRFTNAIPPLPVNNAAALTFRAGGQVTATSNGLNNLQQLTIAAWVRQTDDQYVQRYVTLGAENAVLRYDVGLHFYLKLNDRLVGIRVDTAAFTLNSYHHVAGTYDGATLRLYLDGKLVGSQAVSGTVGSGSGIHFSSVEEPLQGELDEVRIYNRALTPSAIRDMAFTCALVSEIPQIECQALVALYASTDGDQWRDNQGWLRTNTPCSWSGIFCNRGRVTDFFWVANQMRGALPPELGNLTKLRQIILTDSQLRGAIPPELGKLINLEIVWLYNNQLSGAIPPALGNLINLQTLNLTANQLSGTIPPELGNLINLQTVDLSVNHLSGAIPPELGKLTNAYISLRSNQLGGSIPTTLCQLRASTESYRHYWGYNKFLASDPCLANKDPDWMTTQTAPPTQLQAQALANQQTQLTWTPIPYTADGGYYTVLASVTAGGPYTVVAQTADKTATGITLPPLGPGTHYLIVRSFTPRHGEQQNDLLSDDSAEVVVVFNTPPVAASATWTVTQGSPLALYLNASDVDTDPLNYSLVNLPSHGAISGSAPDLSYTPAPGFTGEDSFTFKANDSKADSNLATITLHVVAASPVNTPPVAQDDAFTVTHNSQANLLAVLTNDQDADGDALFLVAVDPPRNGTAQIVNEQLHYTPAADFVGIDHFTYTVSDGKTSTVATVNVTVTAPVGGTTSQAIYLPLIQR